MRLSIWSWIAWQIGQRQWQKTWKWDDRYFPIRGILWKNKDPANSFPKKSRGKIITIWSSIRTVLCKMFLCISCLTNLSRSVFSQPNSLQVKSWSRRSNNFPSLSLSSLYFFSLFKECVGCSCWTTSCLVSPLLLAFFSCCLKHRVWWCQFFSLSLSLYPSFIVLPSEPKRVLKEWDFVNKKETSVGGEGRWGREENRVNASKWWKGRDNKFLRGLQI